MGIFPQTDSAIYGDYVELLKNVPNMKDDFGIIGTLLETPNQVDHGNNKEDVSIKLDEISADALNMAMESDASQDSVVVASQSSQCTVVKGPPGTGKSQVIVNLISNGLAKGQKVLLVCQKKYALDVVYNRLEKIGLSKHTAVLKDVHSGRAPLYKKLRSLLESRDISDDINLLNIEFRYICDEIDKIVRQQSRLIDALKDQLDFGVTINKLYTLATPGYVPKLALSKFGQQVKYYMLRDLIEVIKNLETGCKKFDNPEYPWKHRTHFSKLDSNDENVIFKIINGIKEMLDERQNIIQLLSIDDQLSLLKSVQERGSILDMFLNIENGCKIFDAQEYPWACRVDFSNLTNEDKDTIEMAIELLRVRKVPEAFVQNSMQDQQQLISQLNILLEKGFFHRLNPKRKNAHHICENLLNRKIPDDLNQLRKLSDSAEQSLPIWEELDKLSKFLNKDVFNELVSIMVSEPSVFDARLSQMKYALKDLDELIHHDTQKRKLLSSDYVLERRWDDAYTNATKLLDQLDTRGKGMKRSSLKHRADCLRIFSYNYDIFTPLLDDIRFDELRHMLMSSRFSQMHTMQEATDVIKQRVQKGLRIFNLIKELSPFLNNTGIDEITSEFVSSDFESLYTRLYKMIDSLNQDFGRLQEYDRRKSGLNPMQKEILDSCKAALLSENGWDEIVKQEFYRYWIDYLHSKHKELQGNPFETYLDNGRQLTGLIARHREIVVRRILSQISGSIIRPGTALSKKKSYKVHHNPWSALNYELKKKRHILSIRKLIEKYDSIILRIAPCWLATPEAISSIFPLRRGLFDFVIFDEASQSEVQTSITALYRGTNVVILGDEKQLPPSQWFIAKEDEENDDDMDRLSLADSLLGLASRLGYTYLTWHYRSSHQELIDFSNHAFYDKCLKVVPNIDKVNKPIKWITCKNGTWKNRKNEPEASLVVDELKRILLENKKNNLKQSVGIITFNAPQQDAIEEEIDSRMDSDKEFAQLFSEVNNPQDMLSDMPFVKNIEKVQGDERDIIIISVGYAKELKDSQDRISVSFGALNQVGGENRLNVAVTRARKEIIIVCSFDPNKMKIDEKNTGSRRLRDYLIYAKAINESNNEEARKILISLDQDIAEYKNDDAPLAMNEIPLENVIQSKLQERGYTVHTRVGNSAYTLDLAVVHPDIPSKYILGIECDGQSFLSAASTRERDITRQEFLENKGWRLERIWSGNWWRNSESELDRIQQKIDKLRRKDKSEESDVGLDRGIEDATEKVAQFPVQDKQPSIEELIKKGESNTFEFKTSIAQKLKERENYNVELKSSFRYDTRLKQSNSKVLEKIIAKTIAAFMNSEGGTLFIGVDDQGNVLGLEDDYKTLKKQNSDGFEIELRQSVEKYTKNKIANESFKIKFYPVDGKEVCEITVLPSPKPVFVYDEGGKQECYVRIGNSSKPYNLDEFYEYSKRRFK